MDIEGLFTVVVLLMCLILDLTWPPTDFDFNVMSRIINTANGYLSSNCP